MSDLIITGGRIIDPASDLDTTADLYIQDGRIAHIDRHCGFQAEGATADRRKIIDANGCLVTPGLIDCHVHAYEHVTPLGLNIDKRCLSRGVTTVIDAGSAGCSTVNGLRKFIRDQSQCRLFSFLHIVSYGLASAGCAGMGEGGELDSSSMSQADKESCTSCIQQNRDFVVGVKVRLATSISNNEATNEQLAYRRALHAARNAEVPLMVHHTMSSVPIKKTRGLLCCPGNLFPGDIYTHCFHPHRGNILSGPSGGVHPEMWQSKRRGVLFDVGHGAGSFGWSIAEACAREGFWPDLISSDLHSQSMDGPAYDLPCVMTKMLHLGMPLPDVLRSVTSTAARAVGLAETVGSLKVGREADVTILKLEDCDVDLEDALGETRNIRQKFVPVRVFRAGTEFPIVDVCPWPSQESRNRCLKNKELYAAYAQSENTNM